MVENRRPKVVVIAGPTASGKTSLGVELARTLDGEIINADSMQVYRFMDVGTAKPTPEKQKGISPCPQAGVAEGVAEGLRRRNDFS